MTSRAPNARTATVGFRVHLGWAAAVALAGPAEAPRVLDRRRIALADPAVAGSHEPYHAAWRAPRAQAEAIVRRGCRAVERAARASLHAWLRALREEGHAVASGGLLVAVAPPPASLDAAIASHQRVHVAEGHLFREAVAAGCEADGVAIRRIRERELWSEGARTLGEREAALRKRIAGWKRDVGAPWAQDQKHAALAAWIALRAS